ncbi:MAG: hypothetical protein V4730_11770 [Pseudomonadota bacterium]
MAIAWRGSAPVAGITSGSIDGATIGASTPSSVAATTLSSTGVTALKGSITNDSAAAGNIGEFITSTVAAASAVALTTATGRDVTSISLTAGDWDVSGQVDFVLAGVTATLFQSGISLATNTLPSQAGGSGLGTDALTGVPLLTTILSATYAQGIAPVRISLAATTTVYLVAQAAFSVGTTTAYGTIRARRER